MEHITFAYVPADGFLAAATDLTAGAWKLIDATPYEGPNRTAALSLFDAPTAVVYKLQLQWSIGALVDARDGAGSAKDLDRVWDNAQKRLRGRLATAAADDDGYVREAAARLEKSLLLGAGEAQTKLKYQEEVDFGRQQVLTTTSGQAAADVKLLGLGPALADIAKATDALAAGIGHGQGAERPFERLRGAVAACVSTFGGIAEQLVWAANNGQAGVDPERAAALRAPLEALAARYPAPAAAPPAPAAPPAAAAGGAATPGSGTKPGP